MNKRHFIIVFTANVENGGQLTANTTVETESESYFNSEVFKREIIKFYKKKYLKNISNPTITNIIELSESDYKDYTSKNINDTEVNESINENNLQLRLIAKEESVVNDYQMKECGYVKFEGNWYEVIKN